MPEEPASGHLHRIAALNNCRHVAYLLPVPEGKRRIPSVLLDFPLHGKRLLQLLARASGKTFASYVADHSMAALLLRSTRLGPEYWHHIMRWGLHEQGAILEPRRRVRLCPTCREEDLQHKEFFWYRRVHQFAGMEWCPFHGMKLIERVLNHGNVFAGFTDIKAGATGADAAGSNTLEAAPRVVRAYTALISWMFEESPDTRRHVIFQLFADEMNGFSGTSMGLATSRIAKLSDDAEAMSWFQTHFHGIATDGRIWVPENSFYHAAVAVASCGEEPGKLIQRLNDKVEESNVCRRRILEKLFRSTGSA